MTAPARTESLADLLEKLVDTPSVTGEEAALAGWIEERLRRRGTGEVLRSGNAVVWRGPRSGRGLMVLAGHIDTVPPAGNARARREAGNLYGVGSSDMKCGDAVMLELLDTLDPAALRFDLAAVFYDAEEGPHEANGLRRLLGGMPWLREAALAVLLEPTDLQVELGCNGVMNAEVRVTGRAAHAARPWLGINAVERAAPWLAEITRFPVTPRTVGGVEYRETLQLTVLRAGRARNVIPDELVANLNHRFTPDTTVAQAEARLRSLVPQEFEFHVTDFAEPGLVMSDRPEIREFIERFRLPVAGKQGWTDVAQFTAAGIPAFNFGPGLAEQCHQAGEYCPLANLGRAYECLAAFLQEQP